MDRICRIDGCRNKAEKNRLICRSCRTAKERENLERYSFGNLKRNAMIRGIAFTLTLEEFCQFCKRTGYLARKGRFKDSLHIDRINEKEGYHAWNIQTLTNSQNVIKFLDYKYDRTKMVFNMRTTIVNKEIDGCPF